MSQSATGTLNESELYDLVLGKVVCQHRERTRLGQLEAATSVGLTQSTWSRLESGKARVGPFEFAKIAALFNLSPDQLHAQVQAALVHLRQSGTAAVPKAADQEEWWLELLRVVGFIGLVGLVIFAVAAALSPGKPK